MAIQLQSPHDSHKNARFGHCHSPRTTRKTRRRRRLGGWGQAYQEDCKTDFGTVGQRKEAEGG
nr:hypothetical protein I308_00684 [Cryptococcus tetragattii IND107]